MEWLSGGDMVWWDNRYACLDLCCMKILTAAYRQSMHRSNPYLESMSARDVRRSTIIDDGPFAFGVESQGNEEAR
jgi:alpha-ketoglutarate-dependent 2,4-dichlorophenoxyacetate dioxygenase